MKNTNYTHTTQHTAFVYPFILLMNIWLFALFGCCKWYYYECACVNICIGTVLNSLGHIPRNGITGSYGNSMFYFLKNEPFLLNQELTVYQPNVVEKDDKRTSEISYMERYK